MTGGKSGSTSQAFILGLVAQEKYPAEIDKILQCIGRENLSRLVETYDFNREAARSRFTQDDVIEAFKPNVITEENTKPIVERWANLFQIASASAVLPSGIIEQLSYLAAGTDIIVEDRTYEFIPADQQTQNGLSTSTIANFITVLKQKGFSRHGCITVTDSTARRVSILTIAHPERPAMEDKYRLSELRALIYTFKVAGNRAAIERVIISKESALLQKHAGPDKCDGLAVAAALGTRLQESALGTSTLPH